MIINASNIAGIYNSYQNPKQTKLTQNSPTPQRSPTQNSGVEISSSLQNVLSHTKNLKGDWSDRFSMKYQSLGASSFAELGQMKFASEADFNTQGTMHATLFFNSRANHYAVSSSSRNLEYLDEIGQSLSDMITMLDIEKITTDAQAQTLAMDFEDSASSLAHFAKASVGTFNLLEHTIGVKNNNESAQSLVINPSNFTQVLLDKDYTAEEFDNMKKNASSEFKVDETATRSEADDVLNHLFSAQVFKNGKLDLNALGITDGNFAELIKNPEKHNSVIDSLKGALSKLKETIVTQGEEYKKLKQADAFYENALNQYNEGRYGIQTLTALESSVNGVSSSEKVSFVIDFWSDQIDKNRHENLLSWLTKVEESLSADTHYEPLDLDKGNEKSLNIVKALSELANKKANTEQTAETNEQQNALIDDMTKLIFNDRISFNSGEFGTSSRTLIQRTEQLL